MFAFLVCAVAEGVQGMCVTGFEKTERCWCVLFVHGVGVTMGHFGFSLALVLALSFNFLGLRDNGESRKVSAVII